MNFHLESNTENFLNRILLEYEITNTNKLFVKQPNSSQFQINNKYLRLKDIKTLNNY